MKLQLTLIKSVAAASLAAAAAITPANADTVLLQLSHSNAVAQRLHSVQQVMSEVAQLTAKAYALGELTLTEALQARRNALEAHLGAQAARWDTQEALARVLVDAHQLWPAEEDAHH